MRPEKFLKKYVCPSPTILLKQTQSKIDCNLKSRSLNNKQKLDEKVITTEKYHFE